MHIQKPGMEENGCWIGMVGSWVTGICRVTPNHTMSVLIFVAQKQKGDRNGGFVHRLAICRDFGQEIVHLGLVYVSTINWD